MNYFENCKTEQETKNAYRGLSKILHPDIGGTEEQFKELGNQYHAKLKSLSGSYNCKEDEKAGKRQYHYDAKIEELLLTKIRELQGLQLPEIIEIHLLGSWIWVRGSQQSERGFYPVSDRFSAQLKKCGLEYHSLKGEYYFRDAGNKSSSKGKMSFNKIKSKYSGVRMNNSGYEQVQ